MCMTMAKSLCTIMTRDCLGSRKRASDAVNITSLTTQLFYAVLLDFMTAYQLVGFNAKLTPEAVKELKKCKNIEENMLKYVTNYSGDNVNSKKDLREPGKNMLGELQKPKYDPNYPNKKRTQMKVIPARLCGGGITTKWMQITDTCYPCLVEVLMLVMVRKLFDEAKISNKEKKKGKDVTLPFAHTEFRFQKMKLERKNEKGDWDIVTSLEEMRPKTNVNSMGQGYITLTDMVMKAFPVKDNTRTKKLRSNAFDAFTVENVFDYSLPKPPISEDDDNKNDDDNDDDDENNNDEKNSQSTKDVVIDTWQEVINGDDFNTHIKNGVEKDVNEFDVTDEIKKKMKDTITSRVLNTLKEAHERSLKLEKEREKEAKKKNKV